MTLKFAMLGAGFWSRYQLAGWQSLAGVECVAVCDPVRSKAQALAEAFNVPQVYEDAEELLSQEKLDFVDIVTSVETHSPLVHLAAKHKVPVICQKPMATDLATCRAMLAICEEADIPFLSHENWRFQHPIRQFKQALDHSDVGRPFRAHIFYANSFPVFENQPFLKTLDQFIITDIGSHILDVARYLFGDASTLYCQTQRVNPDIKGEDVATVMMTMGHGVTVTCSMSYASPLEHDRFPETFILAECEKGSVELAPDFWVRTTTDSGTNAVRHVPPHYDWADPAYDMVHSSIVACNASLLQALQTGQPAETSAQDNYETMRLVFESYESAKTNQVISLI